jgi:hypothetical protein
MADLELYRPVSQLRMHRAYGISRYEKEGRSPDPAHREAAFMPAWI